MHVLGCFLNRRQSSISCLTPVLTPISLLLSNLTPARWLAINGGLGNTDLALLPIAAVDLQGGWLDYARAKTAIPRRIPLWTETVGAVNIVFNMRSEPKDAADAELLFIGRRRESYIGGHKGYRIHQEASRVFK